MDYKDPYKLTAPMNVEKFCLSVCLRHQRNTWIRVRNFKFRPMRLFKTFSPYFTLLGVEFKKTLKYLTHFFYRTLYI